jgi:hypothetical protein
MLSDIYLFHAPFADVGRCRLWEVLVLKAVLMLLPLLLVSRLIPSNIKPIGKKE